MIALDGTPLDFDMCAYDLAKALAKYGYVDVSPDAVLPHLGEFLARITVDAAQPREEGWEAGPDVMHGEPEAGQPVAAPALVQPRYGRVRVYPIYVFVAIGATDPEVEEIWITDLDKEGLDSARAEATREAAMAGATVGRLLRVEQFRWRPYAGTPKDAKPW